MSELRQRVKQALPAPIWRLARETRYALGRAAQWPAARFDPRRLESIRRLGELKNIHSGQRCFIIGNGPSLKHTDLRRLRGEFTFGMNRFYLLFDELGFHTTYYLAVNSLVIEQCAEELRRLPMPRFISWRSRNLIQPVDGLIYLHTTYTGPRFARDARGRLWEGATVTYVALQLAYHMGFDPVILIGVDHSFSTPGKPNTTVVSQGDDPNHFSAEYFGKGFRWQLPDLETSEKAYQMALQAYHQAGRQVLDATVGGKLTVFPKVAYDDLI